MKKFALFLIVCYCHNYSSAQFESPLKLRVQFNGKYGYTIIGNTHNITDNKQIAPLPLCQMTSSSTNQLNLQANQPIVGAYLYWSGIGNGLLDQIVSFNGSSFNATTVATALPSSIGNLIYYGAFKDVSQQVMSEGNGTYNFSELDLNSIISNPVNYCASGVYFSGWSLIVVYEDDSLQSTQLNIYDGLNISFGTFNGGVSSIPITNLNVKAAQNAKISYVAWNGSTNLFLNESITLNGNVLSNALNPANNPFNSTNSFTGSTTNWNQDIDTFDISPYVNVGDTSASLVMRSFFLRLIQTVVTSVRSELPDAKVQLTAVSGQNICNNRALTVNYNVDNTNSNGALPVGMPVSFYANNVLLSTVNTTLPIAIGGVLPLQTVVNIPAAVGSSFTLRVVVDDNGNGVGTVAESNEANNSASQNITLLEGNLAPAFSLANTFCFGASVPVLPTISTNGVSGVWSPTVISNVTSGTYTFTPSLSGGICASSFTLAVVITPSVAPTFSIANAFCSGAVVPVLPSVSANGVSGVWLPAVISNVASGTYTFTPAVGQCAAPFVLNVSITPVVVPLFAIASSFCSGAVVPVLPSVSANGVSGVWSPAVISNVASGTYTFTPTVGLCAAPFVLNVNITPVLLPVFAIASSFCLGGIVPVLPSVSANGVSGVWSPAVLSNVVSGTYVFTPSGNCNVSFTLDVDIITPQSVVENLSICSSVNNASAVNAVLLDTNLSSANYSFTWRKDGVLLADMSSSLSVVLPGVYLATANKITTGCKQDFVFNVDAQTPITATIVVPPDFSQNQIIAVTASGGTGNYSYSFDGFPFQPNASYAVTNSGQVSVVVKDDTNCAPFSKTMVLWQYPNFFTPNGDGYNDTWQIITGKKIEVSIFNRYGKLLTQLRANEGWNGTFKGQNVPADDYWFVINYDNGVFKGHFSLKR